MEFDSSGVQIIETAGSIARSPTGWSVEPEPLLDIGVADGEPHYLFAGRVQVASLGGGVLTADERTFEVRSFASDGSYRWSAFGRRGEGPGDFEALQMIPGLHGDSLLFFDPRQNRYTLLSPSSSGLRTIREPPRPADQQSERICTFGRVVAERTLTFAPFLSARMEGGYYRQEWTVALSSPDRGSHAVAGTFEGLEVDYPMPRARGSQDARSMSFVLPFAVPLSMACGERSLFVTEGHEPTIREFDAEGALRRILRLREPPRPITAEDLDDRLRMNDLILSGSLSELRDRAQRLPSPDAWPAFWELRVDLVGWIWARDFSADPGLPRWIVFDPAGRARGYVELPLGPTFQLEVIGEGFVLGTVRGPAGEVVVRKLRLNRTGT